MPECFPAQQLAYAMSGASRPDRLGDGPLRDAGVRLRMGFTLTAANYTIYESLSWRYDHYAQSQDRNHRIGQDAPVTYMRLLATDTIDEAIVTALERKSGLARALLGDEGAVALVSALTRDEMCALIADNKLP